MTLPAVLFGFLICTLYGAAFHLWRGGGLGRLVLYVLLAWSGFWTGHFLATQFSLTFGSVGAVHLGMATLGSMLFLLIGYWLSLIKVEESH
jgi:hypothetical protein